MWKYIFTARVINEEQKAKNDDTNQMVLLNHFSQVSHFYTP